MVDGNSHRGSIRAGLLAFLFVLACAGAGALVAGFSQTPLYRSSGLVNLSYNALPVLAPLDSPAHSADLYARDVASAIMIIRSRRVVEEAMLDPVWQRARTPVPAGDGDELLRHLEVRHASGSSIIEITYSSPDAKTAANAVNSVINSCHTYYTELTARNEAPRLQILESRKQSLSSEIALLTARMNAIFPENGGMDPQPFYAACMERLSKLDSALADIRLAQALAKGTPLKADTSNGKPPESATAHAESALSPDQFASRERSIVALRDQAKEELLSLARKLTERRTLEAAIKAIEPELAAVTGRLHALNIEATMGSNPLTVVSSAEVALHPESRWHHRHVALTAAASGGTSLLLVLLIAAFDRKR